ncbi:hypothetical protein COO60DRAFT_1101716 [Scenedesmus sp. NREL 46B-D3]|nr:hypothetical protein COO60DRAFT_1101716 [Scenedesmus sp. NREL 46B-D3]
MSAAQKHACENQFGYSFCDCASPWRCTLNVSALCLSLLCYTLQLTPLPRLSLEFQVQANSRRNGSTSSSSTSVDDCTLHSPGSSAGSTRWQPSMSRIHSGHDLLLLGVDEDVPAAQQAAVGPAGTSLQDVPTAGEAPESLGHGELGEGMQQVEQDVTETHLLQVGAMLGEASSRAALLAREAGGPVGHPGSFYGSADTDAFLEPWELLVCESSSSVLYWAWRRPLRKGLYMYMTRSVFLGASPAELRAFMNDDAYRVVWDNSMNVLRQVAGPAVAGAAGTSNASLEAMAAAVAARKAGLAGPAAAAAAGEGCSSADEPGSRSRTLCSSASLPSPFSALGDSNGSDASSTAGDGTAHEASGNSKQAEVLLHESGVMQALVQFPKPMASRSYIYGRRVWHRPSDGGCYSLSKACSFEASPALPCRAVSVGDFVAGCVVRRPAAQLLPAGCDGPAAEVLMVYFEDSHVRPGLVNLGIKKGLWPMVQKTDKALRVYQAGAAARAAARGTGGTGWQALLVGPSRVLVSCWHQRPSCCGTCTHGLHLWCPPWSGGCCIGCCRVWQRQGCGCLGPLQQRLLAAAALHG